MNYIEFYYNRDKYKGEDSSDFLSHYGILGQKWGQRRWQNADGTFNEEGKIRYFGKSSKNNSEDDKVGSLYTAGQKIKNLFPQKRVNDNGEEYDARYQNDYGYLTEKGKKYLERHPHDATGKLNMKLYAESLRRGAENDAEREKERLAREAKQKSDAEYINSLKSNIKTTKELKGKEISDKEFKDIIQELDNFDMRDFERNHKEDYNKVADIGIDALNKAEGGWVEDDIRDDGNREWFMWEDQTIGNPEIAYLYYKGYSKDYIKQYLNKTVPTEDYGKYTDEEDSVYGYPYSKGFFVKDEFHRGGNDYIDALFDNQNDQKIGSMKGSKVNPKYQNPDGSLTEEGKQYYWKYANKERKLAKKINLGLRDKLRSKIEEENEVIKSDNRKAFDESAKEFGYKKVKQNENDETYGDKPSYEKIHNTKEGKIKELVYDETDTYTDWNKNETMTNMPQKTTKLSKENSKKDFKEVQDMFKNFSDINHMIKYHIADDYDIDINNISFIPSGGIQTYYYNNHSVQNDNTCMGLYNIETEDGNSEIVYVSFRPDGLVRGVEYVD